MDLFYRGYDSAEPISSGARHLSAAAARFAVSIVSSIPHLPNSIWEEFQAVLTVKTLWSLCLVLAGWLVATVIGGLIGLAVNALLVVYGLIEMWEQIKATGGELRDWAMSAYQAESEAQLDMAATHFAAALSKGGIALLEVIVTHRVFRAVEGKLRDRFPAPEWLSKKYEEAVRRRKEPSRVDLAKNAVHEVAKTVVGGVRYAGAKRVADDFPTAAVALTGAALAAGTVAVAAWAVSSGSRKVRP